MRESKAVSPMSLRLLHVKITLQYEQRYFEGQIHHFLPQAVPALLLD
jgi:hypothetical protein